MSRTALPGTRGAFNDVRDGNTAEMRCGAEPDVSAIREWLADDGARG
jgi:hypothetical protein